MMGAVLVDCMGSDLTVANAARVSFDKHHAKLTPGDEKLIAYLHKHDHWSPFSHCTATFRCTAPIFVARQLFRHQVGLAVNEVSRRYVDDDPEIYTPVMWRARAENVKQGSTEEEIAAAEKADDVYRASVTASVRAYKALLEMGAAPEQARMVLPQAAFTTWYWTGSLAAFARICKLRLEEHAQRETGEVCLQISNELLNRFPVSWRVLRS